VVLLGFALAGAGQVSIPASLLAIAAFLAGAAGAGVLVEAAGVRGALLADGLFPGCLAGPALRDVVPPR
jgi:hypothetical protein